MVIVLLGFILRKVFVNSLGNQDLGIKEILTNLLAMLGLIEGVSIVYNLYKTLAEDDIERVIVLVQLYKKYTEYWLLVFY